MEATLPPIVILGTERSGSNLLRKLIGNHSRIAAPRPAHFYNYFFNHLHHYGPLANPANAARLYEDLAASANHPRSDWKLETTFAEFATQFSTTTFAAMVDGLHRLKSAGKPAYFCKDNDMQKYALALLHHRPDTRFLYLHRDPRDTVLSWLKTPAFYHHVFEASYTWLSDQREVAALRDAHGVQMHTITYEALIARTEDTMTAALGFLGFDAEPACFATKPEAEKDAQRNALWQNLDKPVMTDNVGKFARELAPGQIEIIEAICKPFMARLDYALATPARWHFSGRAFKLGHWWDKRRFRAAHREAIATNTREVLDKNAFVRARIAKRAKETPAT